MILFTTNPKNKKAPLSGRGFRGRRLILARGTPTQIIFEVIIKGAVNGINGAAGKEAYSDSAIRPPVTLKSK
jgi:hypothetical protein